MFDKFKKRMLHNTDAKYPAEDSEPISFEPDNTDYLLVNLTVQAADYPYDLEIISPLLDSIHQKIEERENMPFQQLEEEDSEPLALDASVEVLLSPDHMVAFAYVLAPIGEGCDMDENIFLDALLDNNIVYGIDTDLVSQITETKSYNTIYAIARGTAPVHGIDGQIIDHFSRDQMIHLDEDEKGVVDYKSLNLFQMIQANDIICDIVNPIPGQDGQDVKGKILPAAKGKMPAIPKGKNTALNEDESALIAEIDGDLSFVGNAFRVASQLVIPGDVDHSTGNLDFNGDILIQGDVCKGFSVHANGNVIVCGMAEGASISADGNIEIKKGMNGSGEGALTASGSVYSRFLEQTSVTAGGDVNAETIVNSHIISGGSIYAVKGMGSIIAGTLLATKSVVAKRIGNLSNIRTTIKIGYSVKDDENIDYLLSQLKNAQQTLSKITQSISFLEKLPSIPDDRAELYRTLLEQKNMYETLVSETNTKLTAAKGQELDYRECFVQGDIIYAITAVSLMSSSIIVNDTTSKCKVYYSDRELLIGTF